MNKYKLALAALSAAVIATGAHAQVVVTEYTEITDAAGTVFDGVKTFVLGVVIFGILIGILKMIRRGK